MKVQIKEAEGLVREVSVEIPIETVKGEMEKKFSELCKKITLKGFRKGKAPMDQIKAIYAEGVKADVAEELIRSTYPEAVSQNSLRVASHPTVTGASFADDGGFTYTAEVEVFPEIGEVNYEGLVATVEEVEVRDEEVDEFVKALRRRFSELRPVDREARDGDVVVADLKKLKDPGLVLPDDTFTDQRIDLGSHQTVREFKEHLPGMKAGSEKEIEIKYADDYPDSTFAGAHLTYLCHVREVQERILPEFNDAFAKQTGQAETALELRLKLRDDIMSRIKENQDRNVRSQLIGQLCDKNQVPVPQALLEEYLKKVIEDFKKRYKDVDEKEVRENYREVGARTIRWNMLYHHLSEQEKIEVSPTDTENRIRKFAENYQMSMEEAKQALAKSGTVADVRDSILEEKVLDFLVGKANVVTVVTTKSEKRES